MGIVGLSEQASVNAIPGLPTDAPQENNDGRGCCFSIGYGAYMKPCCLKQHVVSSSEDCQTQAKQGATSFYQGECPATAEEAENLMRGIIVEHDGKTFMKALRMHETEEASVLNGEDIDQGPSSIFLVAGILAIFMVCLLCLAGHSSSSAPSPHLETLF